MDRPHFLLFSESSCDAERQFGRWHFRLESIDGSRVLEASDTEANVQGERLALLAIVRGLEAIDGPARVTLVTPSRQISRRLRDGLRSWRSNGWKWERDGRLVPVKNGDLWRRIDRAQQFHQLHCRTWRLDAAHGSPDAVQVAGRDVAGRATGQRHGQPRHAGDLAQPGRQVSPAAHPNRQQIPKRPSWPGRMRQAVHLWAVHCCHGLRRRALSASVDSVLGRPRTTLPC